MTKPQKKSRKPTTQKPAPPVPASTPVVLELHVFADRASLDLLQQIVTSLSTLHGKVDKITMTVETLKAQQAKLIADFDAETTAVATRLDKIRTEAAASIQALKDQIAAGSPATAADLQSLSDGFAAMEPISARLQALGSDPAAPIPPADDNPPVPAGQ